MDTVNDSVQQQPVGPTQDAERIGSLDVLRGFALLGILVMNIQSFSMPSSAYFVPASYGDLEQLNGVVWLLGHLFFDLKFMALFSMMFGAGITLMSQRRDAADNPLLSIHYRRMALLLIFGLVHAYVIWYGDILVPYALCGMVVVWARRWPPIWLAISGGTLIVFGSLFYLLTSLGMQYAPEVAESVRVKFDPPQHVHQAEIAAYLGAWMDHFPFRAREAAAFQLFVFPLSLGWRIAGLMLLGMALFKWGVLSASRSTAFYTRMAILAGVLGLPLVGLGAYWAYANEFDPTHMMGVGAFPNWYGSVGVALMWLALVMLAFRSRAFGKAKQVLSAYGRTAFTNYIGQSVLATWLFYGYGLGLFGSLERTQQAGVVVAIWIIQLAMSSVWLRYFRYGPLEWVWRSGVYLKLQPMKRRN